NHVGWGLLTAFTERWHPETGTFHLPIGEMTITLDDVSCLLHVLISGKMLNHVGKSCTIEEGKDMCEEFLNFNRAGCQEEFEKMKGAHIGFRKLQDIYHDNLNQALQAENNQEAPDVAWIMVHFKRFGMHFIEENYTHKDPVAAKFYPLKSGKILDETRTALDRMEVDEVTFCPYEDHRQTRPF
ncbi:serine/threonine-protein phosphatase 7 long form-like protein, partial [Trifolium medium]|nr:serine/threonine-protein phosphatase 7 long form-like protein [Trifolium medium]